MKSDGTILLAMHNWYDKSLINKMAGIRGKDVGGENGKVDIDGRNIGKREKRQITN